MMKKAKGEFYSGASLDEVPRFAVFEGRKVEVVEVLGRKRLLDAATGKIRDLFKCRLADGSTVEIEKP
jgi:hypothetical protein